MSIASSCPLISLLVMPVAACSATALTTPQDADEWVDTFAHGDAIGEQDAARADPIGYCGDGRLEGIEPCDDGNWIDGDGCDSRCTLESPPCVRGEETRDCLGGGRWTNSTRIDAPAGARFFTIDASLSGDVLAIAESRSCSEFGCEGSGMAWLYTRTEGWAQNGALTVEDSNEGFGAAVSVAGNHLAIGQIGRRRREVGEDAARATGYVHLYRHDGRQWLATETLVSPHGATDHEDHFGRAIALRGNTLGVLSDAVADGERARQLDLYQWTGAEWIAFERFRLPRERYTEPALAVGTDWFAFLRGVGTATMDYQACAQIVREMEPGTWELEADALCFDDVQRIDGSNRTLLASNGFTLEIYDTARRNALSIPSHVPSALSARPFVHATSFVLTTHEGPDFSGSGIFFEAGPYDARALSSGLTMTQYEIEAGDESVRSWGVHQVGGQMLHLGRGDYAAHFFSDGRGSVSIWAR